MCVVYHNFCIFSLIRVIVYDVWACVCAMLEVLSLKPRRRREEREAVAKEREAWYFAVGCGGTEMISLCSCKLQRLHFRL